MFIPKSFPPGTLRGFQVDWSSSYSFPGGGQACFC